MENLKYFRDTDHDFIFAYERRSEFFVRYIPSTEEWEDCDIPFSNLIHDHYVQEIGKEEVVRRTNGNLPESKLEEYLNMLNRNSDL